MSDEIVRVPAALVEALREALDRHDAIKGWKQPSAMVQQVARALVDAVERPTAGEGEGRPAGKSQGVASAGEPPTLRRALTAPAAPVGEPRKPWVAPRGGGYSAPNTQNHPPRPGQSLSGEPVPPKGPGAVSTTPPAPLLSPRRTRDEGTCDHDCAVIVSYEDYQRSEGVCVGCGVRMKNDTQTGWGPLLPFGDVPCGSRVGECCPPHKFTNEGAPDVCDTCGDSEHPPASDEGTEDEAEAKEAAVQKWWAAVVSPIFTGTNLEAVNLRLAYEAGWDDRAARLAREDDR